MWAVDQKPEYHLEWPYTQTLPNKCLQIYFYGGPESYLQLTFEVGSWLTYLAFEVGSSIYLSF